MKRLNELVKGVPCAIEGNSAVEVKGIAYNSTQVQPGFLFVAVEGFAADGRPEIASSVSPPPPEKKGPEISGPFSIYRFAAGRFIGRAT